MEHKVETLDVGLKQATAALRKKYDDELATLRVAVEKFISNAEERYSTVNTQLTGLLPGAMAAGLSAAYEEKKADEVIALNGFNASFSSAIKGLVFISAIPLIVDLYLLIGQGKELVQIVKDMPFMLAAILPLYFPILWFAYSANKKANLSKRLIEEYTHKSVLGKTFSGLSNQIETLDHQGKVKDELRTRLLFNVLQVSAENPGKLITDYNKSDHPLMEALENSVKLADSISSLSRIPGFAKIAKKLADKGEGLLKAQDEKVSKGLKAQEKFDEESSDNEDDDEKHKRA